MDKPLTRQKSLQALLQGLVLNNLPSFAANLQEYAAAETATNWPRLRDNMLVDVEPEELKLIAAMFEANTAQLLHAEVSMA